MKPGDSSRYGQLVTPERAPGIPQSQLRGYVYVPLGFMTDP